MILHTTPACAPAAQPSPPSLSRPETARESALRALIAISDALPCHLVGIKEVHGVQTSIVDCILGLGWVRLVFLNHTPSNFFFPHLAGKAAAPGVRDLCESCSSRSTSAPTSRPSWRPFSRFCASQPLLFGGKLAYSSRTTHFRPCSCAGVHRTFRSAVSAFVLLCTVMLWSLWFKFWGSGGLFFLGRVFLHHQ